MKEYNLSQLENFPRSLEAVFEQKPYLRDVALIVLLILTTAIREGWDSDYDRLDAILDDRVFTDFDITAELTKDIPALGKSTPTIMSFLLVEARRIVERENLLNHISDTPKSKGTRRQRKPIEDLV